MLAEALKTLFAMFTDAQEPKLLMETPTDKTYLINGLPTSLERHRPVRNHTLETIDDLAALANAKHKVMDGAEDSVVVWYAPHEIRVVLDNDGHRLDTARMRLKPSEALKAIQAVADKPLEQRAIIKILSHELKGAIADEVLLDKLRVVHFENNQTVRGEKTKLRESLSKSLIGELIKTEEIPSEIVLNVPIFSNPGLNTRYPIRCNFEIDPLNQLFWMQPQADEINKVIQIAMNDIRTLIEENFKDNIPIYQGSEA